MSRGLLLLICFAIPFLTAVLLAIVPFAGIYMLVSLFKKQPEVQPKKDLGFVGYLLNNLKKDENESKRTQPPQKL